MLVGHNSLIMFEHDLQLIIILIKERKRIPVFFFDLELDLVSHQILGVVSAVFLFLDVLELSS